MARRLLFVASMLMELGVQTFPIVIARSAALVVWYRSGWEMWRVFAPVYQRASERHPDVLFGRVDAEREAALARCCRIDAIPTLMGLRQGRLAYLRAGVDVAESLDAVVRGLCASALTTARPTPGGGAGRRPSRAARA